jgi:MFS superfamily sulfate permease-like transporter
VSGQVLSGEIVSLVLASFSSIDSLETPDIVLVVVVISISQFGAWVDSLIPEILIAVVDLTYQPF